MPCRFCEALSLAGKNYCGQCYNDIVEKHPTMPVAQLADEYGFVSKSALCGWWKREKPKNAPDHPGTMHAAIASRRAKKQVQVALDEIHRPNIRDRKAIGGCRWIDHEDETVYGETAPGADWEYCQRPRLHGKNYCAHHYPRTVQPKTARKSRKFTNNIKGSARLPVMAYA